MQQKILIILLSCKKNWTRIRNKGLIIRKKEILRSNGFINKLQPRFEAICERLQEIDNETQKKLWGEVVLKERRI